MSTAPSFSHFWLILAPNLTTIVYYFTLWNLQYYGIFVPFLGHCLAPFLFFVLFLRKNETFPRIIPLRSIMEFLAPFWGIIWPLFYFFVLYFLKKLDLSENGSALKPPPSLVLPLEFRFDPRHCFAVRTLKLPKLL